MRKKRNLLKIEEKNAMCADGRVTSVRIEITNMHTGEVFEEVGYARCATEDLHKFDFDTASRLAAMRGVCKCLKKMLFDEKKYVEQPLVPRTKLDRQRDVNDLLEIHEAYLEAKLALKKWLKVYFNK